ncbi:MAG: hypothetical protein ACO2PL_04295 [Armatimonadota bacterium]
MRSAKCGVNLTLNGRARLLPSRILSANREIGKSASRETAANSDWRMVKRQRVANGDWRMLKRQFSGRQCYRTAEKIFRRISRCALQQRNFGLTGRFALPNAE